MRLTTEGNENYEVNRVHFTSQYLDGRRMRCVETCDNSACKSAHFWSVYERQHWGGALCVADCPTEAYALDIAKALKAPKTLVDLANRYRSDVETRISILTEERAELIAQTSTPDDPECEDYAAQDYDEQLAHWNATLTIINDTINASAKDATSTSRW